MAEGWPHSQEAPSGELLTLAAFSPQSTSSAHITPAPGPPSPSPFCASRVHPEDTGAGKPGPGLGSLGQDWSGQCPDSSWPPQLQRFLPCRWLSASILSSANPSSCTTWRSSSQPAGQGLARSLSLPACCSWPCSAVGNTPPPTKSIPYCLSLGGPWVSTQVLVNLLHCHQSSFLGSLAISDITLTCL